MKFVLVYILIFTTVDLSSGTFAFTQFNNCTEIIDFGNHSEEETKIESFVSVVVRCVYEKHREVKLTPINRITVNNFISSIINTFFNHAFTSFYLLYQSLLI